MPASEAQIRDALCARLDLIEPGLQLLKKEQFIPNELGTRSFIDLFARDVAGKYVIIELKKSGPASREAIHELLKYVEGVKAHFAAREDEIRTVVISTDWSELLVPFSSFVGRRALHATGYLLVVDDFGNPHSLTKTELVDLPAGRLLPPWHDLNLYRNETNLEKGIRDHERVCRLKGIESYVMVVLKAHPEYRDYELRSTAAGLAEINGQPPDPEALRETMPEHTHILYFAHQQLTEPEYRLLLSKFPDALEEIPKEDDAEAMIYWLHNALDDADPRPYRDYYEVGTPAKFGTKLLVDEGWSIERIIRHGAFARNTLLSDAQIIADLSGEQGVTRQIYVKTFMTCDQSRLSVIREDVRYCLRDNPAWKHHIVRILDEISETDPNEEALISIVNPSNVLLSAYLVFKTGEEGKGYVPNYFIAVGPERAPKRFYTGVVRQVAEAPPLSELIARHHDGVADKAMLSLLWGGYEEKDAAIVRDLGLAYQTLRVDFTSPARKHWQLADDGWTEISNVDNPLNYFYRFLQSNPRLIRDVDEMYSSRWNGFMATLGW